LRILHTADWHIGRRFHNVSLLDDQADVLEQFIALARDARPDAIVIAGDVYDRADPSADAVRLLDDTLSRLAGEVAAPILIIAGNHDNGDRLGFGARLLAAHGLHIAGRFEAPRGPVTLTDRYGPVHFHLLPYADPPLVRDALDAPEVHGHEAATRATLERLRGRDDFDPAARNVLVFHGFVTGGEGSESERPLSVGGTGEVSASLFDGFCYVALGHLHRPQRIGADHIRYAGSLMKYSFSEAEHRKSVSLVELAADGAVTVETTPLVPRRDLRIIEGPFDEVIARGQRDARNADYVLVRLQDEAPRLDALARIREAWPNVLHLERPALLARLRRDTMPVNDVRSKGLLELFEHFYRERRNEHLSDAQRDALVQMIDEMRAQARQT
jgi:exonuclease SbcD